MNCCFVAPSIDEETRAAVMKRIDTTIAEGKRHGLTTSTTGASVNSALRDQRIDRWRLHSSSISTPIPLTLPNSIVFCASPTLWSAT